MLIMDKMIAVCPKCNTKAEGKHLVRAYFGLRWLNKIEKPQSYCKNCRVKQRVKTLNKTKAVKKA